MGCVLMRHSLGAQNLLYLENPLMEYLLQLPDNVVSSFFSDWNCFEDIVRTDKACGNRKLRAKFLSSIQSQFRPLENSSDKRMMSINAFRGTLWALRRQAKVATILMWGIVRMFYPKMMDGLAQIANSVVTLDLRSACEEQQQHLHEIFPLLSKLQRIVFPEKLSDPDIVFASLELVPNLKRIDFSNNEFHASWKKAIEVHGDKLESIRGLKCSSSELPSFVPLLFEYCVNLLSLSADGNVLFADRSYSINLNFFRHAKRLKHLELTDLLAWIPSMMDVLSTIAPQLHSYVQRSSTQDYSFLARTSTAKFANFLSAAVNLRVLRVSCGYGATDEVLVLIGRTHHHLEELDLGLAEEAQVTDRGLLALSAGCPKLRQFSLVGAAATDVGVIALMTACPGLTHLNLERWTALTDAFLLVLPQLCPYLRELTITGQSSSFLLQEDGGEGEGEGNGAIQSTHYTIIGMSAVVKGCRHLRSLTVPSHLYGATNQAVQDCGLFRPGLTVFYIATFSKG
jgi:hypothetical protein